MEPPRLWHFRISHYNEKVRWALDHKGWPHRRVSLTPGFHIRKAKRLTGQSALPILEIDGRVLHDSSAILVELERMRPDPALFPTDEAERTRALAIEDYFDEQVAPDLRRLFWATYIDHAGPTTRMVTDGKSWFARVAFRAALPIIRPVFKPRLGLDPVTIEASRQKLGSFFDRLESEIRPSGYLVGDRFTIADLGAAAVMSAIIRPPQFPYPLPEPWPTGLIELRDSVKQRRGYQWVLDIYAKHRGTSAEIAA